MYVHMSVSLYVFVFVSYRIVEPSFLVSTGFLPSFCRSVSAVDRWDCPWVCFFWIELWYAYGNKAESVGEVLCPNPLQSLALSPSCVHGGSDGIPHAHVVNFSFGRHSPSIRIA